MTHKLTKISLLFIFFIISNSSFAQVLAFVDSDAIIPNMPAYKNAKVEVEAYGKTLQKQLETKQSEVQKYYAEVMNKAQGGLLSPAQQKEAEDKLAKMQEDLQKQAAEADQKLVEKEAQLTKPIYEKFDSALKAVAKENGYNYIIDKKILLYNEGGINATAKIKAKLGI